MSDYIPINVQIAGRPYRLKADPRDEETVRKAAKEIDGLINQYSEHVKHSDKQDLATMAALHFATIALSLQNETQFINQSLGSTLTQIDTVLAEALKD